MRMRQRRPFLRAILSCLAAGLLGGCGGARSPSTPTTPPAPVATPPDNFAAGGVIQVVSAETAEPIDGATVTIAGRAYTSAAGRITLQDRVPLRSEVDIVAAGMLERHTLVRDLALNAFTLWPSRSPTGMDEGYTQAIVYNHSGGPSSLRRLVPSRLACAPARANGLPRVTSGGQYSAQSPLQVLFAVLSWAHMYSVFPWASTRTRPRLLEPTLTTVPPEPPAAASVATVAAAASTAAAARLSA